MDQMARSKAMVATASQVAACLLALSEKFARDEIVHQHLDARAGDPASLV